MNSPVFKLKFKHFIALICLVNLTPTALLPSAKFVRCDIDVSTNPPFPQLTNWARRRFHITSESVDELAGVETCDEYHDVDQVKSTYYYQRASAISEHTGATAPYKVKYFDGPANFCYTYQPYWCKVTKISELDDSWFDHESQAWNFNVKIEGQHGGEFRAMGVYGLWLYASMSERTFSQGKMIYSSSQDDWSESLVWTVRDEARKMTISLVYAKGQALKQQTDQAITIDPTAGPTLEMIQIEQDDSLGKSHLIRTINVLSVDYTLSDTDFIDHFSPPVGFGCFADLEGNADYELALKERKRDVHHWFDLKQLNSHIELEVTGTKFGEMGSSTEGRVSETYTVELALSHDLGLDGKDYIELNRFKNSDKDQKVVVNHLLQVVYVIDMRQGTCKMAPYYSTPERESARSTAGSEMNLRFDKIDRYLDVSFRLFEQTDDIHFVKRSPAFHGQPEITYYESSGTNKVLEELTSPIYGRNRQARIIWTYARPAGADMIELKSMTVWVLDDKKNRLLESYQINMLAARAIGRGWPDQAKMFDISEECYLENEHMKQNRDYAWLQFTYPVSSQVLPVLARNEIELKSLFYSSVVDDFTRVPRLEVMFEDDSFVMRMLMLDVPATELIYKKTEGQMMVPVKASGDLDYIAVDERHCGHMCRINQCTVMTYCLNFQRKCLLSTVPVHRLHANTGSNKTDGPEAVEPVVEFHDACLCDTYKMPAKLEQNKVLKNGRLHNTIARFKHQNYGTATLPKQPDEILLPQRETGLNVEEYLSAFVKYKLELDEYMMNDGRSPELVIAPAVDGRLYFFVPNKFYLENDPMHDLNIYDDSDDYDGNDDEEEEDEDEGGADGGGSMMQNDQKVPRYHQGLHVSRYKVSGPVVDPTNAHKIAFRTFTGLSYDQCALACTDSKCGTFSYCKHNEQECILSSINSTGRAQTLGVVEGDADCFIMQRDFLSNFIKYENIYRPQSYTKISEAGDASDCALDCVAETNFRCLSFEFCSEKVPTKATNAAATTTAGSPMGECYFQSERHLPGIWQQEPTGKGSKSKSKSKPSSGVEATTKIESGCDHYSRSYLADFVRVDASRVVDSVMSQLKTSTFNGLSVFGCAEKCTSELLDCSAFQFCHSPTATNPKEARECTTIESKITAKILRQASGQQAATPTQDKDNSDDGETIVDEQNEGLTMGSGKIKYLTLDDDCQLFTMRRDSSAAHLRDLAFGGLVKTAREKAAERENANESAGGHGLSFFGGLFLYLSVALVSAAIGCGAIILKDNNEYVRQKYDRLRIFLRFRVR